MATTINKLVSASMRKIGVLAGGAEPKTNELADVRSELIGMLDTWRLEKLMVVAASTVQFTLSQTSIEYTYSTVSGSDFLGERPVKVLQAVVIDAAGSRFPLESMTVSEWGREQNRAMLGTPRRFVYIPSYPQAKFGLDMLPTETTIELVVQAPISTVPTDPDEEIDFAPGYYDAIMYNLAVRICPDFEVTPDNVVVAMAVGSKRAIKTANFEVPKISPQHPGSGQRRFNINEGP